MAARPRKNNVNIPNLYPLLSRKSSKVIGVIAIL
ncbi:Uncharacterised protein [Proteus mirabilis]|uniref:Integrase lambda-type N-terminal DNA-binding domain-containing protein n=1 Tax=Proteus mirabilis TaxID=584 RepID=A0A379FFR0_PROMI|nr:Uncharacterised protein [Proteus mirabilis]